MVRMLVLYNRPEDPEAFDKHYNEIHIPLAKQMPGLLRYTVSRNLSKKAPYYLIAELDWEDMDAMRASGDSEIGAKAGADVANFATGGATTMVFEVAEV